MPTKDFFDVMTNYDPIKEVVPIALQKFHLDMEEEKFNILKEQANTERQIKLDEIARKKIFTDAVKADPSLLNDPRRLMSLHAGTFGDVQSIQALGTLSKPISVGRGGLATPQGELIQGSVPPPAPISPFAKIDPKDYTPESVKAFMESAGTGQPNYNLLLKAPEKALKPTQYEDERKAAIEELKGEGLGTPSESQVVGRIQEIKERPKSTQDFRTFEKLYPQWKGKQGAPGYTDAFNVWWKDHTKTTFFERVSTGKEKVGTPEEREADINAVLNNRITLDDLSRQGGLGGIGGAYSRQIRTEVWKQNPGFNFVLQRMMVEGDRKEIDQLQGMRGKILSFEQTAIQNAKQVHALASKIEVSQLPVINGLILKGETSLAGDPVASNYMLAWRTFVNEYARVSTSATGGGITSDTARKEIEDAIKKSNTPEMIQANMRQAVLEMEHRRYGFDKQAQEIYNRWGGRSGFKAELPTEESIHKIFASPAPSVTEVKPQRTEVERRKTKTGKTLVKYSDGSVEEVK